MASGASDQNAKYALSKLLKFGTVEDYQREFEKLMNRVTDIPDSLLISYFFSGLKLHLQHEFFVSRPATLGDAFSLACIIETRYEDERSITAIAKSTSLILTIGGSQNKASGSSTTSKVAHEIVIEATLEVASEDIRETTTAADTVAKIEETVESYTSELKEHGTKPKNKKSNRVMSVLKDEGGEFVNYLYEINLSLSEEFVIRVLEGRDVFDEKSREVFSVASWAAEGRRMLRKKSVGCSSERRDCAPCKVSVVLLLDLGPGSFAQRRIWNLGIKIVLDNTLRARKVFMLSHCVRKVIV
nr:reverse transcriptase [Tanacetum cinerariifolium]